MLWARYSGSDVEIDGYTEEYSWGDHKVSFCHCPKCGCTTHWCSHQKADVIGVNARLFDHFEQHGIENVEYSFGGDPVKTRVLEDANG